MRRSASPRHSPTSPRRDAPQPHRPPTAGVTLLELVVAMTLLGLLAVGILMALRIGLNAMERSSARMNLNRRVTGVHRILDNQISGLIPAIASCTPQGGARGLVFQGEPNLLRFVSSYSLSEAARGYPRLLEFMILPGENGEGVRLVQNEIYYAGPSSLQPICLGVSPQPTGAVLLQFAPPQISQATFILADQLAACRFQFLREVPGTTRREWVPLWREKEFPLAIRILMAPLRPDPSRAQFRTLTLPVRVNRDPNYTYDDYDPPPPQQ